MKKNAPMGGQIRSFMGNELPEEEDDKVGNYLG